MNYYKKHFLCSTSPEHLSIATFVGQRPVDLSVFNTHD